MITTSLDRLRAFDPGPFLAEAERYFSNRPTGGEDAAHWANVYNAENCRKTATLVGAIIAEIERLRGALEPFAKIADMEVDAEPGSSVIVNVDRCRDARAALSGGEA